MPKKPNGNGGMQEYDAETGQYGFSNFQQPNENVIDIEDDEPLKRYIEERQREKPGENIRESIANYILKVFGGQQYKMPDGTDVFFDHRDRLKLVDALRKHHSEQISNIKKIIDNSVYDYAALKDYKGEKSKFNEYKYYITRVRYKNEIIPLWINVGLTKNDKTWHVYDITTHKKMNLGSKTPGG